MSKHVAVTGANGFVGRAVCRLLKEHGHTVTALTRTPHGDLDADHMIAMGHFTELTDWSDVLQGVDVVVHLAARVHVMKDKSLDPLAEFRRQNVDVTRTLCTQAAEAGVKRLVYLSSIKVNGEHTDQPFQASDRPDPKDSYGLSKAEAEEVVRNAPLESVIIRPPLVYGPHVKANFLALLGLARRGLPVPFGCLTNKRSMVYVDNLASAIEAVLTHPSAAHKTYLVSDGHDLSVKELYQQSAQLLGKNGWTLPIPAFVLDLLGTITRKKALIHRLTQSLEVDSSPLQDDLDWTPPVTTHRALEETVHWYKRILRKRHK